MRVLVTGTERHLRCPVAPTLFDDGQIFIQRQGTVVVGIGGWLNLLLTLTPISRRTATDWEAAAQLAFDILQLTALLYLTGGIANPFALLIIAPVTLAGASLPVRYAGRRIDVRLGAESVEALDGATVVARHARAVGKASRRSSSITTSRLSCASPARWPARARCPRPAR